MRLILRDEQSKERMRGVIKDAVRYKRHKRALQKESHQFAETMRALTVAAAQLGNDAYPFLKAAIRKKIPLWAFAVLYPMASSAISAEQVAQWVSLFADLGIAPQGRWDSDVTRKWEEVRDELETLVHHVVSPGRTFLMLCAEFCNIGLARGIARNYIPDLLSLAPSERRKLWAGDRLAHGMIEAGIIEPRHLEMLMGAYGIRFDYAANSVIELVEKWLREGEIPCPVFKPEDYTKMCLRHKLPSTFTWYPIEVGQRPVQIVPLVFTPTRQQPPKLTICGVSTDRETVWFPVFGVEEGPWGWRASAIYDRYRRPTEKPTW